MGLMIEVFALQMQSVLLLTAADNAVPEFHLLNPGKDEVCVLAIY